ncbi:MAG: DUF362 domain-containing protein [Dehalococcoidales bacterium]|nr:DUF362 domain-containing protein [Dehalococcoidales bacterium]
MDRKPVVSLARGQNSLDTARACVGERLAEVIKPGDRVLLKINQVGCQPAETGSTVRPELIGLVAEMAKEAGASEVTIAEDAGRLQDTTEVFAKMGTDVVAKRVGARLLDLAKEPHPRQPVPGGGLLVDELEYSAPLLECDVLVGVTKLKTHHAAGTTGALKNLFGAVPHAYKSRFHRSDLDKALVDINSVRKADFTVVDGFPAMEGIGPHSGQAKPMNVTIAGADPVAVDTVCAAVMGIDPLWVRHLRLAGEKGLGVPDLAQIEVQGVPIAEVAQRFRMALDQTIDETRGYVEIVDKTNCSGCACVVSTAFSLLHRRYGMTPERARGWRIYMGDVGEVPDVDAERVLLLGDCTKGYENHANFIGGCAPIISQVMLRISEADEDLTTFGTKRL